MPFRRVEIATPLPANVVRDRIRARLRPDVGFWDRVKTGLSPVADSQPFQGTLSETEFKLTRVIWYRNSFLPVVRGELRPGGGGGTIVRLTMRLQVSTAAFMVVWIGFVAVAVPWQRLYGPQGVNPNALTPIGMLLFGLLLTIVGFYPEARKAERLIRDAVAP